MESGATSVSELYSSIGNGGGVWFPDFAFVLQTMVSQYPLSLPDAITRRRYYYFLTNMHEMMPDGEHKRLYREASLELFPLTPCLDAREDLFRWLHRVCDHVTKGTGGQHSEAKDWIDSYRLRYKPLPVIAKETSRWHRIVVFCVIFAFLFILAAVLVHRSYITTY